MGTHTPNRPKASVTSMLGKLDLSHVVMAVCVVVAVASVSGAFSDNSLMVHLTTGRLIVENWSIPRVDPYSFTASGEPWVVQSWLVSVVYGLTDQLGGERLVTLAHMAVSGLAMIALALVARSSNMARTVAVLFVPTVLASLVWTQRPTLFGICVFAYVVLIVHKRLSPWLLLPVMWLWVNMHGSFPVGLVWVASVIAGTWIDKRVIDRNLARYLGFALLGAVLGALNPLGPKILGFAFRLVGDRSQSFNSIVEWQSPDFHSAGGFVSLVCLVVVIASGFAGKVQWRYALGVVGLLGASLYSARYLALLPVVLVPFLHGLVAQLHLAKKSKKTSKNSTSDVKVSFAALVVCVAVLGLLAAGVYQRPAVASEDYPRAAVDWMKQRDLLQLDTRLVSTDLAGCYLIWTSEGNQKVFIDDRVDMYPASLSGDYRHLNRLDEPYGPILDRYRATLVLWPTDRPLTNALDVDTSWAAIYRDKDWAVFARS